MNGILTSVFLRDWIGILTTNIGIGILMDWRRWALDSLGIGYDSGFLTHIEVVPLQERGSGT